MKAVDNFYLCNIIGGGAYGTVYLCKIKKEENIEPECRQRMRKGRRVACKMIKQKKIKEKIKKYLVQEIEIMMKIKHENILRFLEAKKTSNNIYIFVEFCNGGDLRRLLELKGGRLEESLVKKIVKQIAAGLNYLNENNAMHRDLKLDNILINFPDCKSGRVVSDEYIENFDHEKEEIEVIIGDLGFAKSMANTDMAMSYCGTPLNMAPEIMNGTLYNSKVDIWSLGTMIYELLVGFAPFTGCDPNDLAERVNKGDYGVPKNIKLSLCCVDLLNKCLQHRPEKRIDHSDVLDHPFLMEDEESEQIDLAVSRGPGQASFFDAPSSGFDVSDQNAIMFNAKESVLFNQHYSNTMKKFKQKQDNGENVLPPEPEIPDEVSENNLQDANEVEDEFVVMNDSEEESKSPTNISSKDTISSNSTLNKNKVNIEENKEPNSNEIPIFTNKETQEDTNINPPEEEQNQNEESLQEESQPETPTEKQSQSSESLLQQDPPEEANNADQSPKNSPKFDRNNNQSQLESDKIDEELESNNKLSPEELETQRKTREMLEKLDKIEEVQEVIIPHNPSDAKIEDGKEPENPEGEFNDIDSNDEDNPDPTRIDYTIVDKPKNLTLSKATKHQFNQISDKKLNEEPVQEDKSSEDQLNGSFEIVHSHEILMMPTKEYYTTIGCHPKRSD